MPCSLPHQAACIRTTCIRSQHDIVLPAPPKAGRAGSWITHSDPPWPVLNAEDPSDLYPGCWLVLRRAVRPVPYGRPRQPIPPAAACACPVCQPLPSAPVMNCGREVVSTGIAATDHTVI